ncbi:hypothetical protein QIA30_06265 (plasmid) [Borreliella turdi]|uniref:hypothetical protein n=1 Tax=Borreliella turdi TaxID=57863 RepID=UPI003AEF3227
MSIYKKRKTYQLRDILTGVNSILGKNNIKSFTKRIIQKDITKPIKMNLIVSFSKSLGNKMRRFHFIK